MRLILMLERKELPFFEINLTCKPALRHIEAIALDGILHRLIERAILGALE